MAQATWLDRPQLRASRQPSAAWLVLWALGMPLDALEAKAQRELPPEEEAKAVALVTQRIETRQPAAYLTKEAWLQNVPFYVDERTIVPRSFIAELLADGDKAVTDVCFESGFNNISNFNRRFQQLKGMTPSHYRRLAVQRLTEQNLA